MSNKTQAFQVLNTFADSRIALIEGMRAAGYKTLETCRPIVIEWACAKTGAEYRETKGGKVVLVSDHAKYEGAKTVVRDEIGQAEQGRPSQGAETCWPVIFGSV